MGYWDETDNYLDAHGGQGPTCPTCGKTMFPADDHGRFICGCNFGRRFDVVTGTVIDRTPHTSPKTSESDEEKKTE